MMGYFRKIAANGRLPVVILVPRRVYLKEPPHALVERAGKVPDHQSRGMVMKSLRVFAP